MSDFSNAVIIIGAGLSGGSAALTVLEAGGKVVIVEKEPRLGGNSVRASSGLNAALTFHQKEQNVNDSVELFAKDTAYSMFKDINAKPTDLVWTLAGGSADGVQWLDGHNIKLPVLSQCGGHSAPRTHRPTSGAAGGYITLGLLRKVRQYEKTGQCQIIKRAKLTRLLKSGNRVTGVEYDELDKKTKQAVATKQIHGSCVVIATGGFCFNEKMIAQYAPLYKNLSTTNGPWAQGEGMLVAEKDAGAKLVDLECVQVHPTGFVNPEEPNAREKILAAECLRAGGALLINAKGRRFTNELGHRDDVTSAERGQKGKIHLVVNEVAYAEVTPHVNMYVKHFKVLKWFDNAKELANAIGCPVENLAETFADYNERAKRGWCPSGKPRFPDRKSVV